VAARKPRTFGSVEEALKDTGCHPCADNGLGFTHNHAVKRNRPHHVQDGGGDSVFRKSMAMAERTTQTRQRASYSVAADFLMQLRPSRRWVLTAIAPDEGSPKTITISAQNEDTMNEFIGTHSGRRNLYYSVNPTRTKMKDKASKEDIAAIEYMLADLDPRDDETPKAAKARYLAALETHKPAPTVIIDSGNGINVLFKLAEPIVLPDPTTPEWKQIVTDVEQRQKAMERLGGKAGTQNIDRILRLPGTTNLPNKVKREKGRVECQTSLIHFSGGVTCKLEDFPPPVASSEQPNSKKGRNGPIDALPISQRFKNLIRGIDDPEHSYESRSERVFAVLVAMARAGVDDEQIEAILDPSYPISAHVLEQAKPQEYLARQIVKAREKAIDPDVARLNQTYALVLVGDKAAIIEEADDGSFRLLTPSAFGQWHANRSVQCGDTLVPLAKYWMQHPQRRQYKRLVFAPKRDLPQYYNLWKGFAVEPKPGDCMKFIDHVFENICRKDDSLFEWVIAWMADIVQHPDKKSGTSLALRGKMGIGKTKFGEVFGSLLGSHYVSVSDPRYVTGQFNSHLVSCLLLHADEGFWAGDKKAEGKLKDLVTGKKHPIEFKGKEAFWVDNYVRLLVSGNPDWIVPAGFEERRFAVVDVGDAHMEDHAYFAAIDKEMDNGGREALLDLLLSIDLSGMNLRKIPKTAALFEQKLASLSPEQGWWLDTLSRGELPWGIDEPGRCPASRLFDRYRQHAERQGAKRRAIETQVGMFLTKHVPGLRRTPGTYKHWTQSNKMVDTVGSIYIFPELAICRERFEKMMQQEDCNWNDQQEWTTEPPPDADNAIMDDPDENEPSRKAKRSRLY
jgi:hypothetical protein